MFDKFLNSLRDVSIIANQAEDGIGTPGDLIMTPEDTMDIDFDMYSLNLTPEQQEKKNKYLAMQNTGRRIEQKLEEGLE